MNKYTSETMLLRIFLRFNCFDWQIKSITISKGIMYPIEGGVMDDCFKVAKRN